MTEGVVEASLAVRTPRHLVIGDRGARGGARRDRALDEAVRVIDEYLDARACDART
jgi:hypothetical protein